MMKKFLLLLFLFVFNGLILFCFAENNSQTKAQSFFYAQTDVQDVVIYPNPVVDEQFTVKGDNISSVEVISIIGQPIFRKDFNDETPNEIVIALTDCEKGMYLVKVTFVNKQTQIKKLLVK